MLENIIGNSLHRISVLALFCFVFETGPHHIAKADLELLVLSYLSSKITETSHHSFSGVFFVVLFNKTLSGQFFVGAYGFLKHPFDIWVLQWVRARLRRGLFFGAEAKQSKFKVRIRLKLKKSMFGFLRVTEKQLKFKEQAFGYR